MSQQVSGSVEGSSVSPSRHRSRSGCYVALAAILAVGAAVCLWRGIQPCLNHKISQMTHLERVRVYAFVAGGGTLTVAVAACFLKIFCASKPAGKVVKELDESDVSQPTPWRVETLSMKDRAAAVIEALKSNSTDTTQATIKLDEEQDPNVREQVLTYLVSQSEVPQEARGFAVEQAAWRGNTEVVKSLPSELQISNEDRGKAVYAATEQNNLEMVQHLTQHQDHEIDDSNACMAVRKAAELGNIAIVKQLFPKYQIDSRRQEFVVEEAVKSGEWEIVQYLISHSAPESEVNAAVVKAAVERAAQVGNSAIMECLTSSYPISKDVRGAALEEAAKNGRLEVVKHLTSEDTIIITDLRLAAALREAAKFGCFDVVEYLTQKYSITLRQRGDAVVNAVTSNQLDLVKLLLPEGEEISEIALGSAVIGAAMKDNYEIMEYLLTSGQKIPVDHRGSALIEAAKKNSAMVLLLTSSDDKISAEVGEAALIAAVQSGKTIIVEQLTGCIDLTVERLQAAKNSVSEGEDAEEIRALLDQAIKKSGSMLLFKGSQESKY